MKNKYYSEASNGTVQQKPCGRCQKYAAKDFNNTPCSYCLKFNEFVCAVVGTCIYWSQRQQQEINNVT